MVIVASGNNATDGSAFNLLAQVNSPLPIVLVSRPYGFVFNDALLGVKDYILCDFVEYGHDFDFKSDTHLFGVNTHTVADKFLDDEWKKFDDLVSANPPKLYFKRELLKKDASETVLPIEYAGMYGVAGVEPKEKFNTRPLEVFFSWGYSSEYRRQLHGKIWTDAHKYGYMVCDNLHHLNGFLQNESNPRKWLTVNIPHYNRYPMPDILNVNALSKISVSHWGAGKKCFRSAESPVNSIMALPNDDYAWTFGWDSMDNCLRFDIGDEVFNLNNFCFIDNLYDIYISGIETAKKYTLGNYISHLEKTISERL